MPFYCIFYLEHWQHFCSAEQTSCAILVEGIMRKNSVKLFRIWASGLKMSLTRFLISSSGGPPVQWSRTTYAISKERVMGDIRVK